MTTSRQQWQLRTPRPHISEQNLKKQADREKIRNIQRNTPEMLLSRFINEIKKLWE